MRLISHKKENRMYIGVSDGIDSLNGFQVVSKQMEDLS